MLDHLLDWWDGRTFGAARSPKFAQLSREMIREAGGLCRMGMHKPSLFNPLNTHHVKSFHEFPDLEMEKSNLAVLCRLHHFVHAHLKNWSDSNPGIIADCDALNKKIMHKV